MARIVVVAGNAAGQGGTSRSPKEDGIGVWHDEGEAFTSCGGGCYSHSRKGYAL